MKAKTNNILKSVCAVSLAACMLTGYASSSVSAAVSDTPIGASEASDSVAAESGDFWYYENSDGTLALNFYFGNDSEVVIPSAVDGKPVTAISQNAFIGKAGLTKITIPDSVTRIGDHAFKNCTGLKSITIPESVTSVEEGAFEGCTGLTGVAIQNGKIGERAFIGCTGLKSVSIGKNVTEIGYLAFRNCTALASIEVAQNNTVYTSQDGVLLNKDKSSLLLCPEGKTGSYTAPDNVTSIAVDAFGCTNLTDITLPDSVTSIGDSAFASSATLTSVEIGNGVKEIDTNAFRDCTALTNITIPNGVTKIGIGTFWGCSGLTKIIIPKSVTSIEGPFAFFGCTNLTIYGYSKSYAETYANQNNIPFVALEAPDEAALGDVNGDGKVSIDDATLVQKYIADLEAFTDKQKAAADTNRDEKITVDDATTIQKFIAELIDTFSNVEKKLIVQPKNNATKLSGDLNSDGKVDEDDIICLYKYMNNEELKADIAQIGNKTAKEYISSKYVENINCDIENADFNGDGVVTSDDVYYFINQFNTYDDLLGDINMDGKITVEDANLLAYFLSGYETTPSGKMLPLAMYRNGVVNPTAVKETRLADVNEDGAADIADASYIYNLARGEAGYTDPNTSWITQDLIAKDKEIRRAFPTAVASVGIEGEYDNQKNANHPYFNGYWYAYGSVKSPAATDKYGWTYGLFYKSTKSLPLADVIGYSGTAKTRLLPAHFFTHYFKDASGSCISLSDDDDQEYNYVSGSMTTAFIFADATAIQTSFERNDYLKNLFIPNASEPDNDAYNASNCIQLSNLSNVVLPREYNSVYDFSCSNLKSLSDIYAPNLEVIKNYCFQGAKLSSIVIPSNIKEIGVHAFCDNNLQQASGINGSTEYDVVIFPKAIKCYSNSDFAAIDVWPKEDRYDYYSTANGNVNVFTYSSAKMTPLVNFYKNHYYYEANSGDYEYYITTLD